MEKETKVYTRRDSATAALKKIGVQKEDYSKFITKHTDDDGDLYEVDLVAAKASLDIQEEPALERRAVETPPPVERRAGMADLVAAQSATAEALKETAKTLASIKPAPARRPQRQAGRTVSSVARELIVSGKSNDEVWKALKNEFKLDDGKKHYPAWYRSEAKRKGLVK